MQSLSISSGGSVLLDLQNKGAGHDLSVGPVEVSNLMVAAVQGGDYSQ